jgi:hypothetical protein
VRPQLKFPAAILVTMALQAAAIAPLARTDGGVRCGTMSCCRGEGAFCPMHAPSSRPSFLSCRSDPEALPRALQVTLSLPGRFEANFESPYSEMLADVSAPRKLWRPTEPGVSPPERFA